MICESCGMERETVEERVDPCFLELFDEELIVNICNECYLVRLEEMKC